MKDLVAYIAKSITLEPEKIEVHSEISEDGTNIITISAPQSQVGRIIGKMGKTINALRTIIKSSFPNERFRLEINEIPGEDLNQEISTREEPVSEVESTPETEPVTKVEPTPQTESATEPNQETILKE